MKKNIALKKNIDFIDLIILLWNNKAIFLAITFLTTFLTLLFVLIFLNKYETQASLNDPSYQLFDRYSFDNKISNHNITTQDNVKIEYSFINEYIIEFRKKLASADNLSEYKEKFQIKENIRIQQLFVNKSLSNNFILVFPKGINGPNILNDYIEFTKYKSLDEIKDKIKYSIENKIIINTSALTIAEKLGIDKPILTDYKTPNATGKINISGNDAPKFLLGTIALNQEIIILRELIDKLQKEKFDYNVFIDKATNKKFVVNIKSKFVYVLSGSVFGIFLSFIFVFIKSSLNIKRIF